MKKNFGKNVNVLIVVYSIMLFCMPMLGNAQEENKKITFELEYAASSFDDVKLSGTYGIGMTAMPLQIKNNFYAGFHVSPCNFNFGLVDSDYTSDLIKFGPALGYYFKPTVFITLPVDALCNVYFKGSDTKTAWGMSVAPTLYAGSKKIGVFAGPMFTAVFTGETNTSWGFRAGIYF